MFCPWTVVYTAGGVLTALFMGIMIFFVYRFGKGAIERNRAAELATIFGAVAVLGYLAYVAASSL